MPRGFPLLGSHVSIAIDHRLVVVARPWRGFSRNARRDIKGDPEFAMVFSSLAAWLAPVDAAQRLRAIRQRNLAFPSVQIVLAQSKSGWSMIAEWTTSQFYALRDGNLVGHVSDWPKARRRQELALLLVPLRQQ